MAVTKIVSEFDEKKEVNEESEFTTTETVGYMSLFRYMDGSDKVFAVIGMFTSIGYGAGMPAMCLLFGAMSDSMGNSSDKQKGYDNLSEQALIMVYIRCGMLLISWGQVAMWAIFAERVA